ncbi:MAG: n-acetylglutamate synthase [Candidatus Zixiibacteriota bacterium]
MRGIGTGESGSSLKPAYNYNGRVFKGIENYDDGDLTEDTRFYYHQKDSAVWATIEGGRVRIGTLIADMQDDGSLVMVWQYLNIDNEFVSGTCLSKPEILPDGRYRLHEEWRVHGPDGIEGTSVIEEIAV